MLAETGNFNAAAERLHLSQPALSRSIQALEVELGLALVDRSQRQIRLTPAGQSLLVQVRGALQALDNVSRQADRLNGLAAGRLVVGSGPLPANHLGAVACAQFLNRYPAVDVSLTVGEGEALLPLLVTGKMDLLLADPRALPDRTDLQFEPLPGFPAVAVVRAGHPLANRCDLALADILAYPCATISQHVSDALVSGLGVQREALRFAFECNSIQLMLTGLRHSDAVGFLLSCNVQEELARGELCLLDLPVLKGRLHSQYGIFTYRPRLPSLSGEAYISIVRQLAAQQAAAVSQ